MSHINNCVSYDLKLPQCSKFRNKYIGLFTNYITDITYHQYLLFQTKGR